MSNYVPALDRIASRLGTNSEAPNQELARELAATGYASEIAEIVSGLQCRDKAVQSDCIKVLYEIGYVRPELITGYAGVFLDLLASRNNRLVWGAMIALSTVAHVETDEIKSRIDDVYRAMKAGSVITVDNGVRVLAAVAAHDPQGCGDIVATLLDHLRVCRASEMPQHAESSITAVTAANKAEFLSVIRAREEDMTPAQLTRIRKIYKALERL